MSPDKQIDSTHTDSMKAGLIVALDVESPKKTEDIVERLYPMVKFFKVGSYLYTACGPEIVRLIGSLGAKVFLDLKFHDIPHTVRNAVMTGTSISCTLDYGYPNTKAEIRRAADYPVFMMTIHTMGGQEMMRGATQAARERAAELSIEKPKIVGVTVLTSDAAGGDTQKIVLDRARAAQHAGLDGIVCSVEEAAAVRQACGEDFIIVTPGIRLPESNHGDQKRVATPAAAVAAGSNYLVVGRPIIEASDPLETAKEILSQMK